MTTFVVQDDTIFVKARKPGRFRDAANALGAQWNPHTSSFEFPVPRDSEFRTIILKGIIEFAAQAGLI